MLTSIEKRNGEIVFFDRSKIEDAIYKALSASTSTRTRQSLVKLSEVATDRLLERMTEKSFSDGIPKVEDIQDLVEEVLMIMGEYETARNYIKYRYEHKKKREKEHTAKEIFGLFDEYIGTKLRNEIGLNANPYSLHGLNRHLISKATQTFWLQYIFDETVRQAHDLGDIHINDLELLSPQSHYLDLEVLIKHGFNGTQGHVECLPPKHFETALLQLLNWVTSMQCESAGIHTVAHLDTYLAPFIRQDNLTYEQVKRVIETFVFNINVSAGVGLRRSKLKVVLDTVVPESFRLKPVMIGGTYQLNSVYKDYQIELDLFNIAFCEVMMSGDANGTGFADPIPMYDITPEWQWHRGVIDKVAEMSLKRGQTIFVNSPVKAPLHESAGGVLGTVEINLSRIGYLSKNMEEFFTLLENRLIVAKNALEAKREFLEGSIRKGLYPYSRYYLNGTEQSEGPYWANHLSVIKPVGMNECIVNFTSQMAGSHGTEDLSTIGGKAFAEEILDFMNEVLGRLTVDAGGEFVLEATPSEVASKRFAEMDRGLFGNIKTAGTDEAPFYTEHSNLQLFHKADIYDVAAHQSSLLSRYSGVSVFHGFVTDEIDTGQAYKQMIHKMTTSYKIPYLALGFNAHANQTRSRTHESRSL